MRNRIWNFEIGKLGNFIHLKFHNLFLSASISKSVFKIEGLQFPNLPIEQFPN